MPSEIIQWFPGHMAKTRRMITENIKNVDFIIEILDARIPYSSRNPEITKLTSNKPTLLLLSKASLADPEQNKAWKEYWENENTYCLLTDCVTGEGMNNLSPAIKKLMAQKLSRWDDKGMAGKHLRAMVLGIPNVGKSTLINRISGAKKAKAENRPGVTRDKQWVATAAGFDLLDMPGILWPKFEERIVGENLALTGAIKDDILDIEALGVMLVGKLRRLYPQYLISRFKLESIPEEISDYDLFLLIGKKRGFLVSGGEVSTERTANMLIDEFRAAKIGRITLDRIPQRKRKEENAGTND